MTAYDTRNSAFDTELRDLVEPWAQRGQVLGTAHARVAADEHDQTITGRPARGDGVGEARGVDDLGLGELGWDDLTDRRRHFATIRQTCAGIAQCIEELRGPLGARF